jgi:hypothetical protein
MLVYKKPTLKGWSGRILKERARMIMLASLGSQGICLENSHHKGDKLCLSSFKVKVIK